MGYQTADIGQQLQMLGAVAACSPGGEGEHSGNRALPGDGQKNGVAQTLLRQVIEKLELGVVGGGAEHVRNV